MYSLVSVVSLIGSFISSFNISPSLTFLGIEMIASILFTLPSFILSDLDNALSPPSTFMLCFSANSTYMPSSSTVTSSLLDTSLFAVMPSFSKTTAFSMVVLKSLDTGTPFRKTLCLSAEIVAVIPGAIVVSVVSERSLSLIGGIGICVLSVLISNFK